MRSADLVICTGAELETGWLPVLMQTAGNRNVQPGTPGYIAAADYVDRLEIPTRLDRAEGDIHPSGNPHIQLDPHNIAKVAAVVSDRLAKLDPKNAAFVRGARRGLSDALARGDRAMGAAGAAAARACGWCRITRTPSI